MSSVHPLRFSVDTVECTFRGEIPLSLRGDLEHGKSKAQCTETPYPVDLAGSEFFTHPQGMGMYPYRVQNTLLLLAATPSRNLPTIKVRLSALGLAVQGHEVMYAMAQQVAGALGGTSEGTLSRIDVAVDFYGIEVSLGLVEALRTRMKYRAYHDSGGKTVQVGKRELVVRIYDKSAQARDKKLGWVDEMHRRCEGYREGASVTRLEAQLRTKRLRELGIETVEQAYECLPALMHHAMEQVELTIPESDSNITRRKVDPRWLELRQGLVVAQPLERISKTPAVLGSYECIKRAMSALAIYAAHNGMTDPLRAADALMAELGQVMREEDIEFARLVETRRRRLGAAGLGEVPF